MTRIWLVAFCATLVGCSSQEPPKKAEVKNENPPEVFTARLDTSKGMVEVEVHRDWAPVGVHHFYNLVKTGYFDGNRIYRVTQAYAQFGINGDPATTSLWGTTHIPADPVKQSNVKGTIAFAQSGPTTRTTQLFFNLRDNKDLDKTFVPIGKVTVGMDDIVERFYSGYGDWPPRGHGPEPGKIQAQGN